MYQDKTLTCKDCGQEFTFSASEQEFFASKSFANEPGRCPACRAAKKQQGGFGGRRSGGGGGGDRQMFTTTCSNCGVSTTVPFKPTGEKPVYCRDCYRTKRSTY
jgi:CxxC-x17-CxxC domain-containing protein